MLTAERKTVLTSIAESEKLTAWDGHILIALLTILEKIAPFIMPFFLSVVPVGVAAEFESLKAAGKLDEVKGKLTAMDWAKLWDLIIQLIPLIVEWLKPEPGPTPVPDDGPVGE